MNPEALNDALSAPDVCVQHQIMHLLLCVLCDHMSLMS